MTTTITHWIDGKPASGLGSRTGDVYDPATGEGSYTYTLTEATTDVDGEIETDGFDIVVDDGTTTASHVPVAPSMIPSIHPSRTSSTAINAMNPMSIAPTLRASLNPSVMPNAPSTVVWMNISSVSYQSQLMPAR